MPTREECLINLADFLLAKAVEHAEELLADADADAA